VAGYRIPRPRISLIVFYVQRIGNASTSPAIIRRHGSGAGTEPQRSCHEIPSAPDSWVVFLLSLGPASQSLPTSTLRLQIEPVRRAHHTAAAAIQDVGVDHRSRDVAVAEQLLDRPDVVSVLQ
jgi:hypothetical protein